MVGLLRDMEIENKNGEYFSHSALYFDFEVE